MHRPFGSLQVIVGLLQLSNVFVELLLDAARLSQVVLQQRDLLEALRVLLLQPLLKTEMFKITESISIETWTQCSSSCCSSPSIFLQYALF